MLGRSERSAAVLQNDGGSHSSFTEKGGSAEATGKAPAATARHSVRLGRNGMQHEPLSDAQCAPASEGLAWDRQLGNGLERLARQCDLRIGFHDSNNLRGIRQPSCKWRLQRGIYIQTSR